MIPIIIKIVVCQFVFLLIYEILLKRETFFQWNRIYLVVTSVFSITIPFLKINWIEKQLPENVGNSINEIVLYATNSNELQNISTVQKSTNSFEIPWETILVSGSIVFLVLLIRKFYQLQYLKKKSQKFIHPEFIEYRIPNSDVAFSFINSIFIGDNVNQSSYDSIINHELVHLKEKHSYDLIFFELLKIVFWFNPFIYLYQRYSSEVHEFIADHATKNKINNYENLLNEVFCVENFKFTNQFFNQSLIKKRIVMLNKKSKKASMFKYLILVPVFTIILLLSNSLQSQVNQEITEVEIKEQIYKEIKQKHENNDDFTFLIKEATKVFYKANSEEQPMSIEEFYTGGAYLKLLMENSPAIDSYQKQKSNDLLETLKNAKTYDQYLENFTNKKNKTVPVTKSTVKFELPTIETTQVEKVSFLDIDQAPTFEACENNKTKDCFMSEIQNHIKVHFNYPEEAINKNIQGKVYCNLIINTKGAIEILNLRAPDPILEKSVYEMMMKLPKLKPAIHGGKPTAMSFSIPISYKLAE
jgi:beta-lactamase regulating signal transducer with metallopeptidase domain